MALEVRTIISNLNIYHNYDFYTINSTHTVEVGVTQLSTCFLASALEHTMDSKLSNVNVKGALILKPYLSALPTNKLAS